MKIRAVQDFRYGNDDLEKGEVYELPDPKAEEAIERGLAERAEEKENEAAWEEMEKRLDEESAGQGSGWLKADDVNEGDEIVITGAGEWNDDFAQNEDDEPDLVLPVEVGDREFQWRLNKTQMRKLADAFGNKTGGWIGERVIVEEITEYESLGKKGFRITAEK